MTGFDFIIVGAGSAGCVLANRLTEDPSVRALLIEAGGEDDSPLIAMPRGFGQLLGDPDHAWQYPIRPIGSTKRIEHWVRGKTLGGSSSINGMVYNRGNRADYDELERRGNPGWGWDTMLPVFKEIEDHPLGASDVRGVGGPLRVSTVGGHDTLLEHVIASGVELGWQREPDLNATDAERIGYAMATIHGGSRFSAADAFLHPIEQRPNLTVAVRTRADRILIQDGNAVGVRCRRDGRTIDYHTRGEVIISAGAIATPQLLQLSGIGPADVLRSAGVEVLVDSPNVGARLVEHHCFAFQFRLTEDVGYNRLLSTSDGLKEAATEYQQFQRGPMAVPSHDIVGFFKTRPELDRPDAQIQIAPYSIAPHIPGKELAIERKPGMMCIGYPLRPTSQGTLRITSSDPDAALDIDANYFATEHDRTVAVDTFRGIRRLFATDPLATWLEAETLPGPTVRDDPDIIDSCLNTGACGYHTIGTAAMGPADDDVVDPELRVRGVSGLRVVDASVFPTMVSGNLNGPVMATAWRAADLINRDG